MKDAVEADRAAVAAAMAAAGLSMGDLDSFANDVNANTYTHTNPNGASASAFPQALPHPAPLPPANCEGSHYLAPPANCEGNHNLDVASYVINAITGARAANAAGAGAGAGAVPGASSSYSLASDATGRGWSAKDLDVGKWSGARDAASGQSLGFEDSSEQSHSRKVFRGGGKDLSMSPAPAPALHEEHHSQDKMSAHSLPIAGATNHKGSVVPAEAGDYRGLSASQVRALVQGQSN